MTGLLWVLLALIVILLLKILFRKDEILILHGKGVCDFEVVGESHYQKNLKRIVGGYSKKGVDYSCIAELSLDDYNKYDSNAVSVEIDHLLVGYLSRSNAKKYRRMLNKIGKKKVVGKCYATIRGGWKTGASKGSFGVFLDFNFKETEKKYIN